MIKRLPIFFILLFVICGTKTFAQATSLDSATKIIIISFNSLRSITIDDSTTIRTLAGNAKVQQGNTTLSGDSIAINSRTNIAEVFGHVHINDADTVNTYADYLRYLGKNRIAYLKRNVRLTDGKASLTTNDLEYNVATGVATYTGGGKVLNGSTALTSNNAIYYSDTKDVYFKKTVRLTDPKYDIKADSLKYNTGFKIATLISPTIIKTKDGKIIKSKNGTYNLQTGEAQFFERTLISDSTSSAIANEMFFDDKTGISILIGNAKFVDSVNNIIVVGNYIEANRKTNSFLATQKPVVILVKDKDSTYIAADTLFSGLRKNDNSFYKNTSTKKIVKNKVSLNLDSANTGNFYTKVDTLNNKPALNKTPQDSVRYILGYRNVRIYNDSSQAVCDSMYYSTEDSVFRMYRNPIVWKDKSQITGDTMYLFTEKQQPKRVYVFNNSLIINQQNLALYNQAAGRTLNAYFTDGKINYARLKGSPAETIFYPQNDDSSYAGMNRCSGDVADVYFVNEEINKIKFIKDVNGTMYPINQIPANKKYLNNFNWQNKRRPKNKLELFE